MSETQIVDQVIKIRRIVADAIQAVGPNGHWPDAVEEALTKAGISCDVEQPDGSDPWEIVRLRDELDGYGSLVVYREGRGEGPDAYDIVA